MRLGNYHLTEMQLCEWTQRRLPQTPIISTEPPQHDKTIVRKNETLE